MNIKRLLASVTTLGALGVAVTAATSSFFSDSETSSGNTFAAGSIDLKLGGNFSSQFNGPSPSPAVFALADQNGTTFFNFTDLKPGDVGGGWFDMQVSSNPSWACMKTTLTGTPENVLIDPENPWDTTSASDSGELQNHLSFALWNDVDGDGVYEPGVGGEGTATGPYTVASLAALGYTPIADSTGTGPLALSSVPLTPETPYHLGWQYCFGVINMTTLECDGTDPAYNDAQTDGIIGDFEFTAVQARNNATFTCASLSATPTPVATASPTPTVTPTPVVSPTPVATPTVVPEPTPTPAG